MPYTIVKGSENVSIELYIVDNTTGVPETAVEHNTSGIDLRYRRTGAAAVAITEASLAALTTAHTDGGIEAIGFGNYRFDIPDAAVATGADTCIVFGTITGMIVYPVVIHLVDCLLSENKAEETGVPAATGQLGAKINWLFHFFANKKTQSATTQTLRNAADSGNISTATTSAAGGTVTKGAHS